ncbi:hypothetical protein BpHYR1_016095 [Brachionus plicatilis]|uniref:Uncharacterized protein n=1 Tax=Brachionus plicatilis TaxID=10195 RepID=A0A3M7QRS4_BRAPC|nr:hypothetical protein BpHYR1_016095 [Brachionus plicatilis]
MTMKRLGFKIQVSRVFIDTKRLSLKRGIFLRNFALNFNRFLVKDNQKILQKKLTQILFLWKIRSTEPISLLLPVFNNLTISFGKGRLLAK